MKLNHLTPEAVKDKIIAIRLDLNVPLENGKVTENTRIVESVPTLDFLLNHGAKRIHILTHVGRPKGRDPKLSTKHVLPELEKAWGQKIEHREDFSSGESRLQLHENVRYYEGEKKNDPELIKEMLQGLKPDIFILDGFAVAHRAHASVVGLASHLPAYPGFLIEKEIEHLSPFLTDEKIPGLTVVVGGAKMETKVNVLRHFAKIAENVVIGGALANTFLAAQGFDVGESLYEEAEIENAQDVLGLMEKYKTGFHNPLDVVCADDTESTQTADIPIRDVLGDMKIFDIGKLTIESYAEILKHSKMIIWNGPMGLFEKKPFEEGTRQILKVIASQKSAQTILGGGDTLEALKKFGVEKTAFTHVSTGGGSMLEFLEGKDLPGLEVLQA